MDNKKKEEKEEQGIEKNIIKEFNDVKERLIVMRGVVDDVLDAVERGMEKLLK